MSFTKIYSEKKQEVENLIKQVFDEYKADFPEELVEAVEYSLLDGGKRLRPILFLECFKLFNSDVCNNTVKFAVAVECVHIYTLIHDDLPSMDNDDFRRGKPSNHKKFGEGLAILAGDALLNFAYELILDAILAVDESRRDRFLKAARMFSKNIGGRGLIAGQVKDIQKKENLSGDEIRYIIKHKTGDLIVSSGAMGAAIANADKDELQAIINYCEHFAFAFQITDDILDEKDRVQSGENEPSFVKIYGKQRAVQTMGDSMQRALKELNNLSKYDTTFLKQLALKFATRKE